MVDFEDLLGRSRHVDLTLDQLDDYYRGTQPLSFLHPELKAHVSGRIRSLVVNWPRLIVDSIEDRLDVEGYRLAGDERAHDDLWRIWQANDLDEWSQQAHLDALVFGRSFVLVWPGEDPQTPRITVESARQMRVVYDPGTRTVASAVKEWTEGEHDFRTVYDRAWITRTASRKGLKKPVWEQRAEPVQNVYGVVPVVPFVNRPTLLRPYGESEMTDVIPLTDAINKLHTDMMVTAEFTAMPRRWWTGMDLGGSNDEADRFAAKVSTRWEKAAGDKVWLAGPGAATGQYPEASLQNYVDGINMLTARVAALAGLPPHYFGQVGENPASADALRSSESSLIKKVQRKQRVFGGAWERVMRLAALMQEGREDTSLSSLETIWRDPQTPTVAQQADAAVKLLAAGAITKRQLREDLGYTPVQIDRMEQEDADAALGPVRAQLDEAARLQRVDGLSQAAAYKAVGLLAAGQEIAAQTP